MSHTVNPTVIYQEIATVLGLDGIEHGDIAVTSPIDGNRLASIAYDNPQAVDAKIAASTEAFQKWRTVPAPKRGELIRLFGEELRRHKRELGLLVTLECGKILQEGLGEVQEMIDICDFAVGLSRQLYGLTIASERSRHVMQESWHPLGPIGIISAFNFPVAVWAWNSALAIICGNPVIWKPSEKTPLCALACQHLFEKAATRFAELTGTPSLGSLSQIILGGRAIGEQLVDDHRVALISATGSTAMGCTVGSRVQQRFGKCLLELGGNNAIIVAPSADLKVALPSILFGAVGTAGQRCTSTRRLFVHETQWDNVWNALQPAYASLQPKIGNPLSDGTLIGPLIDHESRTRMQAALQQAEQEGGEVFFGEPALIPACEHGAYVHPALVRMPSQTAVVMQETFAPILYVMPYNSLEDVMKLHNAVPQGLSSAIFTLDLREAEYFRQTSDCGIANVNIGTSGAEIGGAFGGEKETGGGRESGTDAWKNYMRRQTSTMFYGTEAPELAQGIRFSL